MTDWTEGYVADVGYTYGYYAELNPMRMALPFAAAGVVQPQVRNACELGFGQGLSVAVHSTAGNVEWHGTDFNPAQAAFAQDLVAIGRGNAKLVDQAFDQFCARGDLPEFDYIGLHGIWSWISDGNRQHIVDLVRRKLKTGGVLYISYNTLPGWAPMVPMRHLLTEHAHVMGAPGQGIVDRIEQALKFGDRLLSLHPIYTRANPAVVERFDKLKKQNRNYLAHEYFNRDWQPMPFSRMAEWLQPAKLSYMGSASYLDHIDTVNFSAEQIAFIKEINDPLFRETVKDYLVNQQFRRDYWIKGARRLAPMEQALLWRDMRFVLTVPAAEVSMKLVGGVREASLQEALYRPVLELMSDHKPRSLGAMEDHFKARKQDVRLASLFQAMLVLASRHEMELVQDDGAQSKVRSRCDQLNRSLMERAARGAGEVGYLASPVSGGAVGASRFQQLFILARSKGHGTPQEMAAECWKLLSSQGHRLVKEGKQVESDEESVAELTRQADEFLSKRLPGLKALGVVG